MTGEFESAAAPQPTRPPPTTPPPPPPPPPAPVGLQYREGDPRRAVVVEDVDSRGVPRPGAAGDPRGEMARMAMAELGASRGAAAAAEAARIARNSSYRALGTDDAFDAAGPAAGRRIFGAEEERARAAQDQRLVNGRISACRLCAGGAGFDRSVLVARGLRVSLLLPSRGRLADLHCRLAPVDHVHAAAALDEDVAEELDYFKRHVSRMFRARGRRAVFVEQVPARARGRHHAVVDCVPVDAALMAAAPARFASSIRAAAGDADRPLIDTRGRPLSRCVPRDGDFPYLAVDFDGGGGYAHVVDDPATFPPALGLETVCGILEEPAQIALRARREQGDAWARRVREFRAAWAPFDWTAKLAGRAAPSAPEPPAGVANKDAARRLRESLMKR